VATAWHSGEHSTALSPTTRKSCTKVHCCRVLELEGTRRGQWDYGKARVYWVRLVRGVLR